jgi:catechol 2,3-dioxygenase-like lactoylglutathione lyase family enzyme
VSAVAANPVRGLHHFAWRCRDAEETRRFYEDLLGLPLVHIIRLDRVPSTGEYCPYVHIFFEMTDGSCIAFFDLGDGQAPAPSPNTPDWVTHIALRMDTVAELQAMRDKLVAHGLEVLGPVDHGICTSIYFFDPNGLRLEFAVATQTEADARAQRERARAELDAWTTSRPAVARPERSA